MARRTRSKRQQSGLHALRAIAARSTLDAQLQPLFLPLELPPPAPPQERDAAASKSPAEGSCVIIIDLA
jgi:hypothetical protein